MSAAEVAREDWGTLTPGDRIKVDWTMPWEGPETWETEFEGLRHTRNEFGHPLTYIITSDGGLSDRIVDRVTLITKEQK